MILTGQNRGEEVKLGHALPGANATTSGRVCLARNYSEAATAVTRPCVAATRCGTGFTNRDGRKP